MKSSYDKHPELEFTDKIQKIRKLPDTKTLNFTYRKHESQKLQVGLAENEGGCEHEDLLNSGLPKSFAKTSMDQILEHVPGSSIQSFYFVRKLTKFLLSVPEEFDAKDFGKPKKEHEWFKKKVIGRYFIYNDPQVVDSFDMYYDPDQS